MGDGGTSCGSGRLSFVHHAVATVLAAIAAALSRDRVRAAVLIGGYTIQNTLKPGAPALPVAEHRAWYQWYFNTERGRAGLQSNRRALCRYLWQTWSPTWRFTNAAYERTAASFDNPDFVDVVDPQTVTDAEILSAVQAVWPTYARVLYPPADPPADG